jgi:DNA-binding transcriptional LysR family regulator
VAHRRSLHRLDLNLLLAFDALLAERNVTRAADRLSVGQPAMSASLAKLRRFFGDPLLIREGRGLVATAVAEDLIVPIREALDRVEAAIDSRCAFDPRTDRHTFTVMASDYMLLLLLTGLLDQMALEAPNVRIKVVPPHVDDFEQPLLRSKIDLLILPHGYVPSPSALHSAPLLSDRFVCAIDTRHPDVGAHMTKQQFRTLPYIAYHTVSHPSVPERQLRARGIDRPVEVATQSFVVLPLMLTGTRFFALVHQRLAERFADQAAIRWVDPPFAMDPIEETLFWAPASHTDPAHRWLRTRIQDTAANLDTSGGSLT